MKRPPTDAAPGNAPPAARRRRSPVLPIEQQHSAGGLVVRPGEILLISTQNGRRWQLPKGHIEPGESPEETAVREVREETGVTGRIVESLPGVDYWFVEGGRRRVHKTVAYFLLTYEGGSTADYDAREVSGAAWFSWEEGLSRLTFANEKKVVERAREVARETTALEKETAVAAAAGGG